MADLLWKSDAGPAPWEAPSAFSVGYPQSGDLSTNTHPTHIGGPWFLGAYQEIRTVIAAAGLVFDPTNTGQLLMAIIEILKPTFELREDGSFELREDGSIELRN
jgi:hypothetical protein